MLCDLKNFFSFSNVHLRPSSIYYLSFALDIAISTVADAGQNILVPRPGFPLYTTLSAGLGKPLHAETLPKNEIEKKTAFWVSEVWFKLFFRYKPLIYIKLGTQHF